MGPGSSGQSCSLRGSLTRSPSMLRRYFWHPRPPPQSKSANRYEYQLGSLSLYQYQGWWLPRPVWIPSRCPRPQCEDCRGAQAGWQSLEGGGYSKEWSWQVEARTKWTDKSLATAVHRSTAAAARSDSEAESSSSDEESEPEPVKIVAAAARTKPRQAAPQPSLKLKQPPDKPYIQLWWRSQTY